MRILFITATRIGDAVLSTGLLGALLERHPGARVTIAAGTLAAPLFAAVPGLERLIPMEKRRLSLHWLDLYAKVAASRWDLVVDLRGSALSYLLWTGERRVIAKGDVAEHRVAQLARLLGMSPPPGPRLFSSPESERRAAALAPPGSPILAIGPAANWRGKQWRGERFAELTQRLTASGGILPGARVAVMAAAHERPQAELLLAAIPAERRLDLVGKTDLPTAGAVLRRAALFVGNDSGLMHIAAAAGAPTLGLFGPTQASHYGPWGANAAVVQTTIPPLDLYGPDFDHRTADTMMDSLSVTAAETAATLLFARRGGAAA